MLDSMLDSMLVGITISIAGGLVACSGDAAGPTSTMDPTMVWSLAFQWHAVNLALTAPYDTVTLPAVPRTAAGSIVADSVVVHYSTPDSSVTVSANGLITARFPTAGAHVVARITTHGTTLTDTTLVQVATTPPASLATLSIQPNPDDHPNGGLLSANFYLDQDGGTVWIPFYATTTAGDTVCNAANGGCANYPLLVRYATSDTTIANFVDQYGDLNLNNPGRVTLTLSTLAYGVPMVDSLHASIGTPQFWNVTDTIDNSRHPPVFYIKNSVSFQAFPWTVGFRAAVFNETDTLVELTLPSVSHGVHFGPKPTQLMDTLNPGQFVRVVFDSVGTYTIRHRLLSTGETIEQPVTIEGFP